MSDVDGNFKKVSVIDDDDTWKGWYRLVLHQIEQLTDEAKELNKTDRENYEKIMNVISQMKESYAVLFREMAIKLSALETENRIRSIGWGVLAGSSASILSNLVVYFITH